MFEEATPETTRLFRMPQRQPWPQRQPLKQNMRAEGLRGPAQAAKAQAAKAQVDQVQAAEARAAEAHAAQVQAKEAALALKRTNPKYQADSVWESSEPDFSFESWEFSQSKERNPQKPKKIKIPKDQRREDYRNETGPWTKPEQKPKPKPQGPMTCSMCKKKEFTVLSQRGRCCEDCEWDNA